MPSNSSSTANAPTVTQTFHTAAREARDLVQRLVKRKREGLDWIDDLRELQQEFIQSSPQASQRECGAGCASCCLSAQVDVTGVEAIAASEFLRMCVSPEDRAKIESRLKRSTEIRRAQIKGQLPQRPVACGMLNSQGHCQIYAARPVICSGVFSTDRQACDDAIHAAEKGDLSGSAPLDLVSIQATGGISGGLQRVLVENGYDGNLYELNSAVLTVLHDPHALQRFFDREDIFRDAICTEAHSPPRRNMVVRPFHLRRRESHLN
ncbi:YkgJ family cysteine cluster protein [Bremerella cremea]|uniref:YkgJ family cysteine cluster protein n=1 Tax=Bremerella cremea TaxID=1031537 RepID=UPI0031EB89EA